MSYDLGELINEERSIDDILRELPATQRRKPKPLFRDGRMLNTDLPTEPRTHAPNVPSLSGEPWHGAFDEVSDWHAYVTFTDWQVSHARRAIIGAMFARREFPGGWDQCRHWLVHECGLFEIENESDPYILSAEMIYDTLRVKFHFENNRIRKLSFFGVPDSDTKTGSRIEALHNGDQVTR